ncbi:hypothetical protein EPN81_03410 [Patescibacteria group bacterium]|nr:MAG: hypothetical protein EPN81_03410 [Patescibacteria group bacterium]
MKFFSSLALILLLGWGCVSEIPEQTTLSADQVVDTSVSTAQTDEPKIYVSFIQNVHDWVFPENSLATINRLIDLHEQYQVPVEFYLDDQVIQKYLELEPTIFDRFKTSAFVTISYHIRPPHPAYDGFDTIGLAQMSEEEQYETLLTYETHRLNLVTGGYTDEPGGYAFLKELIGYAPRIVTQTSSRNYGASLSRVYQEMGALFTVVHGRDSTIDQTILGLHQRPEQVEVKLYEDTYSRGFSAQTRFDEWTADWDGSSDYFINLKYHEGNFYTQGTSFALVYWEKVRQGREKSEPKSPPYDLTAGDNTEFRTEAEQAEEWQIYEETLAYVAEHTNEFTAITSIDLENMLDE